MSRAMRLERPRDADAAGSEQGEPINFGPLEHWIGFNLRMAQTAAFAGFAKLSHEIGERPGRFATLMLIAKNPGISQTALSRANGRDKSSLTPVLTDLVRRRLVSRTRTRNDRRTYRLTLTPAGERVLRELVACAERHEDRLDAIVGPRERAQFLRTLKRIAAEMG
ncbi:MAG: winged helix-turn-helix transcriptional regulator [Pseudorhodoplanes sp.]|nr:winged helix-turn-helix transcriptional regulator [Pseudorhodoplanes sp.]